MPGPYEEAILRQQHKFEEAIAAFENLLRLQPQNTAVLSNLGVLSIENRQTNRAIDYFSRSIELDPNYVPAYANLGQLHQDLGQPNKAIDYLRQAIALNPNYATAHYNLGNIYKDLGQLSAAIASYQRAIELQSDYLDAHNNLGNIYVRLGELDLAYQCYQQPAASNTNSSENLARENNWLLAMHYSSKFAPAKIYRQHQNWGKKHESQLARQQIDRDILDSQRPLRIGYVSGDFKTHSVSYFLEPLLANRNRTSFNVTCYGNNRHADGVTARLRS